MSGTRRASRREPGEPWRIDYYETPAGNIPVLEWMEAMSPVCLAEALHYVELLAKLGPDEAQEPLVKPLGDGLWELRWKAEDKQHRIAYFVFTGRTLVLLHGIVKKQMKWSPRDLKLARKRKKDYEGRTA